MDELERKLRDKAIYFLARREYSRCELLSKLKRVTPDLNLIYKVLDDLKQENLQSDQRFLEIFIKSWVNKGAGPIKIKFLLKKHNIQEDLINNIFNQLNYNWQSLAQKLINKKFEGEDQTDIKIKQKIYQFLYARGFEYF